MVIHPLGLDYFVNNIVFSSFPQFRQFLINVNVLIIRNLGVIIIGMWITCSKCG